MKPTLKVRALLFCSTLTAAPCVIAATNYTNTSADDWTTAGNWSGGTVPSGAFNQRINISGGTTVTFGTAQGTVSIGSSVAADLRPLVLAQTAGTATLNITGGTLQANSTATGLSLIGSNVNGSTGILNISGGLLDLTTGSSNATNLGIGLVQTNSTANVSGTVTMSGSGTLKVNGFLFNEGGALTTGTGTINGTLNLNGGTFEANVIRESTGANQSHVTSTVNFNGGLLKLTSTSGGISNSITNANVLAGGAIIEVGTGINAPVNKALTAGSIAGGLTKQGNGTLTLGATNTYTGETIVKAGTLKLNASTTIATSSKITVGDTGSSGTVLDVTSAGITVGSTQTLAGIGTLLATGQTVSVDGILAPGNSPGTLTIDGGTLALGSAANLSFELNPANNAVGGGVNDLVSVLGNLTLDGILNVAPSSGDFLSATIGTAWRLFDYTGTLTNNTVSLGSMPSLGAGLNWGFDTATPGQVNLVVIPEPAAAFLGSLGLLALLRRRR
jgi:fibronectin-binding autotransporter adhesin